MTSFCYFPGIERNASADGVVPHLRCSFLRNWSDPAGWRVVRAPKKSIRVRRYEGIVEKDVQ